MTEPRPSNLKGFSAGLGVMLTLAGIFLAGIGVFFSDDDMQRWMVQRKDVGAQLMAGEALGPEQQAEVEKLRSTFGGPKAGRSWTSEHAPWVPGKVEYVGIAFLLGAMFFVTLGTFLADRDPA